MNEKRKFLYLLLENCIISNEGHFYCKRCRQLVHVNWYKNLATCSIHIISGEGVKYAKVTKQKIAL